MTINDLKLSIRNVPDFPKKGIQFKDLTTAFKDAEAFRFIVDSLYEHYKDKGITKIVGIESRGFIIGSALAYKLNAGIVLVRKPGKLPADTYKVSYSLEYGTDSLEIHKDSLKPNDVILIHDDLLATGGTAKATLDLIKEFNVYQSYVSFIVELSFLHGRKLFDHNIDIYSLLEY